MERIKERALAKKSLSSLPQVHLPVPAVTSILASFPARNTPLGGKTFCMRRRCCNVVLLCRKGFTAHATTYLGLPYNPCNKGLAISQHVACKDADVLLCSTTLGCGTQRKAKVKLCVPRLRALRKGPMTSKLTRFSPT
eukprot:1147425-Pelagomonas_calceolata.AAC.5